MAVWIDTSIIGVGLLPEEHSKTDRVPVLTRRQVPGDPAQS